MGGVYEGRQHTFREPGDPLSLNYQDNNGRARGEELTIRAGESYFVYYSDREGLLLKGGNDSFRADAIGIITVTKGHQRHEAGHFVVRTPFKPTQSTKERLRYLGGAVLFNLEQLVELSDGKRTIAFRVKDAL